MSDHIRDLDVLFALHLDTVRNRFERALEATGYTGVLLYSGRAPTLFLDDGTYPFKVHVPFKVWVPLVDIPDCFIYFEPGSPPTLILHQPGDYWHKPPGLPQTYWTRHFDVRAVTDRSAAREHLPRDLSRVAYVGERFAELSAWAPGAINPDDVRYHLDYERAVKTSYELACIREANRLAALGHVAAARAFKNGASEYEIRLAFLEACRMCEPELPYPPIIALNESGAALHYQLTERQRPPKSYSLLIDAGAEFAGYASDITRTYSFDDSEFEALIRRIDELQQSLCATVRPGVDWRDVHLSAHRGISAVLREVDVIRCDADEALGTGLSNVFMPHGVGHLLGLQVHDVGGRQTDVSGGEIEPPKGHPALRLTRVLRPGFVVTLEPGIYFIDLLLEQARADARGRRINWSRVDDLRRFGGIRIEDDLAVTRVGCENLTRKAFREVPGGSP